LVSAIRRKLKRTETYPRQFWLLFWGVFITRASYSMTWPFIIIYITTKLDVSLTVATFLLTVQSIASVAGAGVISPLMDRFGRKAAMTASLVITGAMLAAMAAFDQFELWIVFIALNGAMLPIYITGVNTMVADIIEEERRTEAYAIIRMVANVGIAIGPVIGGIIAVISFETIYYSAAVVNIIIAGFMIVLISETMPKHKRKNDEEDEDYGSGYGFILKDRVFLSFSLAFIFVQVGYTQMFMLLPTYISEEFSLQPGEYSLLFTVNAMMVVCFQYVVTRTTMRFPVLPTIAIGALFYAIGISSVALGSTLPAFLLSMAVMTIGELIIAPTATAYVARIAPTEMRARYMGLFGIAFPVAMGIGPVIGGFISETISPVATWYAAGAIAFIGALFFMLLSKYANEEVAPA
jgi:MFS family permease